MKIARGQKGPAVSHWQMFLKSHHLYDGPITGSFDQPTEEATSRFQKSCALNPNGVLDFGTYCKAKLLGMPPLMHLIDEGS